MIKEIWNSFPRLLEQKINALLDEAEPRPTKAFQLYKACQRENLWSGTFEKFSDHLNDYFSLAPSARYKSKIDAFLERPLPADLFSSFYLDFRTALVSNHTLHEIASWSHHLMRVSMKSKSQVISTDVLTRVLQDLTNPPLFEKARDIEFEDFCSAWKKVAFKLFGRKYDAELSKIVAEIRWLHQQNKENETRPLEKHFVPSIYLTQTEITWTEAVKKAVEENTLIPAFPLSRGPEKQRLIDLLRTISLYRIVQTTRIPELLEQRANIRTTILDRCANLLADCAK